MTLWYHCEEGEWHACQVAHVSNMLSMLPSALAAPLRSQPVSLSERQVARLQYNYLAGWWTVNSTPALLALVPIHNLLIYNLRAQPGHHWLILLCTLSLLRLLQCAREVLQPVTPHRHDQCSSLQQQAVVARRVPLSTISFPKQRQTLQTPIQIACHAGMLQVVAM